jgi:hypothetical protein
MTNRYFWTPAVLLVLLSLSLLWTVPVSAEKAGKHVYICGCGTAVGCDKMAAEPGKAPCGKDLLEKPVLKEDADKVYVCACPEGCKCGLNQADPTKCACGKELRAYPKTGKMDCPHGMKSGCDKPCAPAAKAGCDKPCAPTAPAEGNKPCCAKPQVQAK